jgi:hypothetical protein
MILIQGLNWFLLNCDSNYTLINKPLTNFSGWLFEVPFVFIARELGYGFTA